MAWSVAGPSAGRAGGKAACGPSSDTGRRKVARLPAAAIRGTGWGAAGTSWISLGIFHAEALMESQGPGEFRPARQADPRVCTRREENC